MESKADSFVEILDEKFIDYEVGPFSDGYSAFAEVHYPQTKRNMGPWVEISTHHLYKKNSISWSIEEENDDRQLVQKGYNLNHKKNWKYLIKKHLLKKPIDVNLYFPALATGDELWEDYRIIAKVKPLATVDICGILFRMESARNHYIFGVKNNQAILLKRDQNDLKVLRKKRISINKDGFISLEVQIEEGNIDCSVDGIKLFSVCDTQYRRGRAGFISNVPAVFKRFTLSMNKTSLAKYHSLKKEKNDTIAEKQKKFPEMILINKLDLPVSPSGRSLRFGDLTGAGNCDIVIGQGKAIAPDHHMITSLTAVDLKGEVLWQIGEPVLEQNALYSDLAFQIYDIDGDGNNEVICAIDFQIKILDGKTGETKKSIPTPAGNTQHNKFSQVVGDAFYICNLTGGTRPQDILFKDRYSKVWAFNNNLELLWSHKCNTGHFPFTFDINNDKRDEILIGYTLLDSKGKEIWNLSSLWDHADAVSIIKSPASKEMLVIIAGSDDGLIIADKSGKIRKQLMLGHMQTVTIGKLMSDSESYQIATNTYWGNPGIVYILDLDGNVLNRFQPSIYGSPLKPVNWDGTGQELLLLSAAPSKEGGLYDGNGNQVVIFPDDGHPTLCCTALDITKDGVDEIICWDYEKLWIYAPKVGTNGEKGIAVKNRLPNELYNESSYRANLSLDLYNDN